ncbi:MAG: hypothetical protein JST17_00195 [Bacteroidetes bacterium]|nr:hypothetical protein [Bacteroidota bacterium]MBS1932235.1 hypothetical protein [Bacteroidota bacterium]
MNTPPPPPPPPSQQNTANLFANDRDSQMRIFKAESIKTRNFLFGIAILYFLGNALPIIIAGGAGGTIALSLIVTIIFLGMGLLATTQPYIAAIISAVVIGLMLILLIITMTALQGAALVMILPWLIFLIAAGLEVGAFMSAKKAEQARKLMH